MALARYSAASASASKRFATAFKSVSCRPGETDATPTDTVSVRWAFAALSGMTTVQVSIAFVSLVKPMRAQAAGQVPDADRALILATEQST